MSRRRVDDEDLAKWFSFTPAARPVGQPAGNGLARAARQPHPRSRIASPQPLIPNS
jgi:hypothetical protein